MRQGIGRALAAVVVIAACASVDVLAGVDLAVRSAAKEARAGGFATHTFSVANTGVSPEAFALTAALPSGWSALGIPETVLLEPGDEAILSVTFTLPADAPGGAYTVALTAQSIGDPMLTASASAIVEVGATSLLEIVPPAEVVAASPGEEAAYSLAVVNRGHAQDVLTILATSSHGFPVDVSPAVLDLAPQEQRCIVVRVCVPPNVRPGHDVLTVTATSALYPDATAEAVLYSTILPSSPSDGDPLYERLSGQLRISLDRDEIANTFDSGLSFSVAGCVLGGRLFASVAAASPLGPAPADVTSYRILYLLGPTSFAVGHVSETLTDFVDAACEGGSAAIDTAYVDLALIGGIDGDLARFAGSFAFGPEAAHLGVAYSGARSTIEEEAIWSGFASSTPLPDWTLRAEAAVGTDDGLLGHAFLFGTTFDTSGYFLSGNAFSVDTYFPGLRRDSAGLEIIQRLRMPSLSISVSFAHVWDNVAGDPAVDTVLEDSLGLSLYASPTAHGPQLRATLEFDRTRTLDSPLQDDVGLLLAYDLSQPTGAFRYAFAGRVVDQADRATGSHVRTLTHSQGVGFSIDAFYAFLRLEQEEYVDVTTGTTLSATSSVSVTLRPEGALHEATMTFGNELDHYDLAATLYLRILETVGLAFRGSMAWNRGPVASPSFGWGISWLAGLDLPVPFLVTKGRIEGRLFVDRDANGFYSEGDRPVEGAVLAAGGRSASTDLEGRFRFPPLSPGTYRVTVSGLPADAIARAPLEVMLHAGERAMIEVPVSPIVAVRGVIYEDSNQDGIRQETEIGMPGVRLVLTGPGGAAFATSDADGHFAFANLLPGSYSLSANSRSLPARFEFTTPETLDVDVTPQGAPSVSLGGYVPLPAAPLTEQPVTDQPVVDQPPTARFAYAPVTPRPSEPVTFDAAGSVDSDGTIVLFAWDFDGDGSIDAQGNPAVHVFADAGRADVTLTLTDNAGNTNRTSLTVEIRESSSAATTTAKSFQPPIADFAVSPATSTPGTSFEFDGSASVDFDGSIVEYAWDFDGDGVTDANGPTASHAFPGSGSYTVGLTVIDDGGNRDTAFSVLEIALPPVDGLEEPSGPASAPASLQPPVADFRVSPTTTVAGAPLLFDGSMSVDPDGAIVGYAWDFDGDGSVDAVDPIAVHVFPDPGTFEVGLTVIDDAGHRDTASSTLEIVLPPAGDSTSQIPTPPPPSSASTQPPIADMEILPPSPKAGDTVLFNAEPSVDLDGILVGYAWDFDGDGFVDSTDPIVVHVFSTAGTFEVHLTVTDDGGNTDTLVVEIVVQ
ncbi:MAG: PKD domain-containing protein [Candidatus Bipolaricaulia bacterium]